jgi:antitoxin VapB
MGEGRLNPYFYPGSVMGMNIKDPQVHAMAKELAARRGTSVTDAVRQALRVELERSQTADAARQEELQALLARFRQLHWPEGVSSKAAQDVLYDDQGLPA